MCESLIYKSTVTFCAIGGPWICFIWPDPFIHWMWSWRGRRWRRHDIGLVMHYRSSIQSAKERPVAWSITVYDVPGNAERWNGRRSPSKTATWWSSLMPLYVAPAALADTSDVVLLMSVTHTHIRGVIIPKCFSWLIMELDSINHWLKATNEGWINVLLWYCLVGTYVGLPLGVEGSPGGKWLCVVWGRRSPPSWHPLVARGSASEQARLVKMVKVQ